MLSDNYQVNLTARGQASCESERRYLMTGVTNCQLEGAKESTVIFMVFTQVLSRIHSMDFYLELHVFGAVPVRKKDEILD